MKSEYGNYIKVYDFMISKLQLAKYDLLVYAYIFSYTVQGRCYSGSQQTLADKFGTCRKTIAEVLKKLTASGLLIKTEIPIPQGKGCEYECNLELISEYHV